LFAESMFTEATPAMEAPLADIVPLKDTDGAAMKLAAITLLAVTAPLADKDEHAAEPVRFMFCAPIAVAVNALVTSPALAVIDPAKSDMC